MAETEIENQPKKYQVKLSFYSFWLEFLRKINHVLNFFSLRQTTHFWGIVYDSVSKQPLDPVIVKLLYVDGEEVETCVTDLAGQYGFLARPGKFKIYARKTNYAFPSKYIPDSTDGIFENLYHGEFFSLQEDYEVVGPNIPMDPLEKKDWNQQAKQLLVKEHPYVKLFIKRVTAILFWFAFILDILLILKSLPVISVPLIIIGGLFILLLGLALYLPEARLWGEIKADVVLLDNEYLFLELHDPQFPGMGFGKAKVKEGGKFLLRSNRGNYNLAVSKKDSDNNSQLLGEVPVHIGREGIFNSSIIVK